MLSSSLSDVSAAGPEALNDLLVPGGPEEAASAFLAWTSGGGASVTNESLNVELSRYAGRGNVSDDGAG
jgi:hypothetical protein